MMAITVLECESDGEVGGGQVKGIIADAVFEGVGRGLGERDEAPKAIVLSHDDGAMTATSYLRRSDNRLPHDRNFP
jgi:hypothetical protein